MRGNSSDMSASRGWRPRAVIAAAVSAVTVTAPLAGAAPGGPPPVPIPEDPGAASVVSYLGHPRPAHPLAGVTFAPRHPFMAGDDRSNLHDDAYQSDAGWAPGPLGYSPKV